MNGQNARNDFHEICMQFQPQKCENGVRVKENSFLCAIVKIWTLWELNPRPFTNNIESCEAKIIPLDQEPEIVKTGYYTL